VVLLTCLWLTQQPLCVHAADRASHGKRALTAGKMVALQVRKEIQAAYDQQSAALNSKDVQGFLSLCTPDYQDLARGKRLYSARFIRQSLPRTLARYSALKMTATIQTLQINGSQATVTATHHVNVTLLPRYASGVPLRSSETVTEDIWIKTDRGWRAKRSKEISYKRLPVQQPTIPPATKPATGKTAAPPAR
jgi:uncharacterized protein (TIGR02246 family)